MAGKRLAIPTSVFSKAGTLIDSGAVINLLPRTVYSTLQKAFMEQMARVLYENNAFRKKKIKI